MCLQIAVVHAHGTEKNESEETHNGAGMGNKLGKKRGNGTGEQFEVWKDWSGGYVPFFERNGTKSIMKLYQVCRTCAFFHEAFFD